ncbi:hypothetical protein LSUE1_G001765 [Lachnellula suecica]|uniref:Integral membrane protein n=1 Tax=Lachnellula suecica TaxID=602035 RepID=A0A8T9CDC9_9HELO|nr:hypothetical protein LSUE1_G001765 [Lachnellula suecica]
MTMSMTASPTSPRSRSLGQGLPLVLRPVLRAYFLGYASSTAPRVLTLLLLHLSRRRKNIIDEKPEDCFLPSLLRILRGGVELQRFPTFCAALVGGSTLLEAHTTAEIVRTSRYVSFKNSTVKVGYLLHISQYIITKSNILRLARWLSTFIAAWYSLRLLQSKKSEAFIDHVSYATPNGVALRPIQFAGRTMDLTLFAITRAVDVLVGELWAQRRARRVASGRWTKFEELASTLSDSSIFASSCALIMWAWIYTPDRLPRSYNKWIKSAAAVDQRLLLALRRMRFGEIKYGLETGQAHVLQGMCKDYNLPLDYGDPVKSIPYPCEVVHMGVGKSCEKHALSRWGNSFLWAFSTYLPLNLILTLRNPSKKRFKQTLESSARSSAFLGTFIALYYYGICLARTRIGPRILGTSTPRCQQIDGGICIGSGCVLCGWSVLIETAGRRKELGLFVAPRALATLFPRRYLLENQCRETIAFAFSTAVVFTCVGERPERVRGLFGKLLRGVLV